MIGVSARGASIAYQAAVLTNSPSAFYRFNDTTTTAADSSGNGVSGTYFGGYTQSVPGDTNGGPSDNAVTFNGTSGYVSTSTFGSLGSTLGSSGVSIELLFKTTTSVAGQRLIGASNANGSGEAILIDTNVNGSGTTAAGDIRFFIRDNSGGITAGSIVAPTLYDGGYNLLDFTYSSAGSIKGYVNGVAQTVTFSSTTATRFTNFTQPLDIAAFNNGGTVGSYFAGTIDEASIYNSVLSPTAITADAAAAPAPEPSSFAIVGLVATAFLCRRRRLRWA